MVLIVGVQCGSIIFLGTYLKNGSFGACKFIRVRFFGMVRIRINDPLSLRSIDAPYFE